MTDMVLPVRPTVPRETFAGQMPPEPRRYHSPYRAKKLANTHTAIVEAVMARIRAGHFQPSVPDIIAIAGISRKTLNKHFGPLHLLMRVVARERWREVVPLLPFPVPDDAKAQRTAVWAVLVGQPET